MMTNGRAAAGLLSLLIGCGGATDEAREAADTTPITEVSAQSLAELSPGSKLSMDLREHDAVVSIDLTRGPIDFSRLEVVFSNGPIRVPDWLKDFNVPRERIYHQDGFVVSRARPTRPLRWQSSCEVCAYHRPSTWICWSDCYRADEPTLRDLESPPTRNHEEELPPGPVREPDTDPPPGGSGGSTGGGSTGGGGSGGSSSGSGGSSGSGSGNSSGGLGGGGPSTPGPGL